MRSDEIRDQFSEVLGLVEEQLSDIAAVRNKQAALRATASTADGMVEVTVNAYGHLVRTSIDESYLDEHDFEELADHVTEAAQAAVADVARRMTASMAPIGQLRARLPALSEIIDGAPDLRDLTSSLLPSGLALPAAQELDSNGVPAGGGFPTVRR